MSSLKYLRKEYYEINSKKFVINESKYKVNINLNNINCVNINLNRIQKNAGFLVDCCKQKDCDLSIINFERKQIYLIEVKANSKTKTNEYVYEQLINSKKWIHFLLKLHNYDPLEFNFYYIRWNVKNASQKGNILRFDSINGIKIYKLYGGEQSLGKIRSFLENQL